MIRSSLQIVCETESYSLSLTITSTICLLDFRNNIYQTVNDGGVTGPLFVNLSKAFDTVNHNILLLKLRQLGFKLSTVNWFKSSLADRSLHIRVGSTLSELSG